MEYLYLSVFLRPLRKSPTLSSTVQSHRGRGVYFARDPRLAHHFAQMSKSGSLAPTAGRKWIAFLGGHLVSKVRFRCSIHLEPPGITRQRRTGAEKKKTSHAQWIPVTTI